MSTPATDLRDLAKDRGLGSVGNQQVFLAEWKRMGDTEAAERMRRALHYLLYGEGHEADRLNDLLHSEHEHSMRGLKEKILTKALCMAFPDRWIPLVAYSGDSGKKEVIRSLFDHHLPRADATLTMGRLIAFSNDLLVEIAKPEFSDLDIAAGFLWKASEHLRSNRSPREYESRPSRPTPRTFVCSRCNLQKGTQQLADVEKQLCRDCA